MAETDMNPLTALVKPHVAAIMEDAKAGNKAALDVIIWYRNYQKCPEPGAQVVCEEAFKSWRAETAERKRRD